MKTRTLLVPLTGIILILILASCTTFEKAGEAEIGEEATLKGVYFIAEPTAHARVRLTGENRRSETVRLSFYAPATSIGRRNISGVTSTDPTNIRYASVFFEPQEVTLAPGESGEIGLFLRNWYYATRNFTIPVQVRVTDEETHQFLQLNVDQNDLFDDPALLYQENKLGRNQPGVPKSKQSAQASR